MAAKAVLRLRDDGGVRVELVAVNSPAPAATAERAALRRASLANAANARVDQCTELQAAVLARNLDLVVELLSEGHDVRGVISGKRSESVYGPPLFMACSHFPAAISVLIERGADLDGLHTSERQSMLHACARTGSVESISLILPLRSSQAVMLDRSGRTPAEIADAAHHPSVAAMLRKVADAEKVVQEALKAEAAAQVAVTEASNLAKAASREHAKAVAAKETAAYTAETAAALTLDSSAASRLSARRLERSAQVRSWPRALRRLWTHEHTHTTAHTPRRTQSHTSP
jgi:hypothetical protein